MDRRDFIKLSAAGAAGLALGGRAWANAAPFNPSPEAGWRTYEITTRLEVAKPQGVVRAWVPVPTHKDAAWTEPLGNTWQGNALRMSEVRDPIYGAAMVQAEWAPGEQAPVLEVTSRLRTRDRVVQLARADSSLVLDAASRELYTKPTELLPTDGIVRETAQKITQGKTTEMDKARAIYEWVVDNTFRDPKTKGCGVGDIRAMLETGNLSGKCADLNALYVGLARASGLPARDVYGIRVADSRFGYKSLGKSGNISKAQHCRAEVFLTGYGWVPVDPADVRKVVLEEKPGLTLDDEVVKTVRSKLFGAWETNWMAYNVAHDLQLPGSSGPRIGFLMYPQGETAEGRLNSIDPDSFRYTITSREITA